MSAPAPAVARPANDLPRRLRPNPHPVDRIFRGVSLSVGALVLALTGTIGIFLALSLVPTVHSFGFRFFTRETWQGAKVGILAAAIGSFEVAFIALVIGFPLALTTALYITEYAPARVKSFLVTCVDLMAAVPSIIFAYWGFYLMQPQAINVSRWLASHLGFIPIFKVDTDPNAAVWDTTQFRGSFLIAGFAVGVMITPLACAVMRGVFDHAPAAEREAALALGATRAGVIRSVVLPFGRGGIIGGTMLALGRALGETIIVLTMLQIAFKVNWHVVQTQGVTISSLIGDRFGDATPGLLKALLGAGFVLFVLTLSVNTAAGIVVSRSRSGAATEI